MKPPSSITTRIYATPARTSHTRIPVRNTSSQVAPGRRYRSTSTPDAHAQIAEASILNRGASPEILTNPQKDALSPLRQYQKLIETGTLRGDNHQTRIIQKLQDLHDAVAGTAPGGTRVVYNPPMIPEPKASSLLSRMFSRPPTEPTVDTSAVPRGLYLYGDVGTGKTMLMDLFYHTLPTEMKRKRRVHFHAFMIDVHKRIHAAKKAMGFVEGNQAALGDIRSMAFNGGKVLGVSLGQGKDPIAPVARDLANEACILCFDEFQVTDIADAMILRRLLEYLINHGVVCVMTSNRHPDDLYKNGIQRSSFIPAIELIKEKLDVTDLDSGTDYRRIPRALSHVYYHPINDEHTHEIDKIFESLTKDETVEDNRKLETWGRSINVPVSSKTVAKFNFHDLCGQPLSAADYLEVTKSFGTIFLLNVPKMGLGEKDMARRFITFIDACYESKTKLFTTSDAPIFQVFSDEAAGQGKPITDHMRSVMDDLGLSDQIVGPSSIFTGDEEVFAFARACSRLVQMGSKEWAETAGIN